MPFPLGCDSSELWRPRQIEASRGDFDPNEDALDHYVSTCGGTKALRRILIASNGMAAAKSIMSMRQWAHMEAGLGSSGILEFISMATREDLDSNADFIRLADKYVEVPPGKNVNNYANVDLICKVAKAEKVDAVWPGWGHASENPRLPAKLKEMGIAFIGPTSPVMSVLGDKIAAGILAQTAGVPSIPWSGDGLTAELTSEGTIPDSTFKKACLFSVSDAISCAERIGYPVMLKASEGGGGKGIRMSKNKEELEQNFVQVQSEVPGSPVFMMQLCTGARHIEVQIMGDQHGAVVALNGRDCSTQRRFQKIFEEGPPVIVPKSTFKEMERAAQRLTQNIGYIGAGTVEYLYNAQTNRFYFLELNPRLQVEHPVTEAITGVNMPATQLQVAMGIPLERMPQIRNFYGVPEKDRTTSIDFMTQDYVYPKVHCLAARITAENPDDAFKPTSGKIERIKFQSSVACWGYFSVWTHAAIHEFADSQFGHLFARGGDREEARKTLVLALQNLDVVGEIRTPTDYLVQLLATEAFKRNTIDTNWLDGLIRERVVRLKYEQPDVVFYAAVLRAFRALQARDEELLQAIQKRRLGLVHQVQGSCSTEVEITFEGLKYLFHVSRVASDAFVFKISGTVIKAQVREQPDASLLVSVDGSVRKISGTEEALGLRLKLQGVGTVLLPTIFDASELRSDFNGKVMRYLVPEGGLVKKDEAYVELEAMKMIMPLKARATGKLKQLKSANSIVQAGELLGSLQLEDPGSVQQLIAFKGNFALPAMKESGSTLSFNGLKKAILALEGFEVLESPQTLANDIFFKDDSLTEEENVAEQLQAATQLMECYLQVERCFAPLLSTGSDDLAVARILEEDTTPLAQLAILRAHGQLKFRSELLAAIMEHVKALPMHEAQDQRSLERQPTAVKEGLLNREVSLKSLRFIREEGHWKRLSELVAELSELPSLPGYSPVLLPARHLCQSLDRQPWEMRRAHLRGALKDCGSKKEVTDMFASLPCSESVDGDPQAGKISGWSSHSAGGNLLLSIFTDSDAVVRGKALEVFVRRSYRACGVSATSHLSVATQGPGVMGAKWRFRNPGVSVTGSMTVWQGFAKVLPNNQALEEYLSTEDLPLGFEEKKDGNDAKSPGRLHLIVLDTVSVDQVHRKLRAMEAKLRHFGATEVVLITPGNRAAAEPSFAHFSVRHGWREVKSYEGLSPAAPCLLEVEQLAEEFEVQRLPPVASTAEIAHVFLGTPSKGSSLVVHACLASHSHLGFHSDSNDWAVRLESFLLDGMHELENAKLNPKVSGAEGRVYLHLTALADLDGTELFGLLEAFTREFVARHGALLQGLWVDEITIKVRLGSETSGCQGVLRFSTTAGHEKYMKCTGMLEQVDPVTGMPAKWQDLTSGQQRAPEPRADLDLRARRAAARKAGSTYAPEFLGLLEAALVKEWKSAVSHGNKPSVGPKEVLKASVLSLNVNGHMVEAVGPSPSTPKLGMLAWRLLLHSPEFPEGRSVVLIANDVTHQAGSFGVAEDHFFKKASEYARQRGLPRVFIACNSGARVGLVEEIMPKIRVHWKDEADPSKGFDYLYLTEADFTSFPSGAVIGKFVPGVGYALDAVVGQGLSSISGGIGVENLQGSGLIAGETSRAYQDIFTLSYVTGRSVGIGAYLNRLGQRVIQSVDGPLVLTGYGALNKLLGKNVYFSQDQLGGPQIMVPNGITHQLVQNDQEGAEAIVKWLSFVPRDTWSMPQSIAAMDPIDRLVDFRPTKQPYDPRHMLTGAAESGKWMSGFFDKGSFVEYMAGWGRSVVVGRARLGGIPMGVIAVETRNVERRIPADPGNPESREIVEPQAGQVWFPDSAFKTATAIRDFNVGENLPLMIFANWRGFSGGTRDMYGEVLKFGAQIVDALVDYKHPVFIYIPPEGELRGGSWVVVDPTINPDVMEMYADEDSRGGILEPAGIVEVKFRAKQRVEMMHRLDQKLIDMDEKLKTSGPNEELRQEIQRREEMLQPLYTQVACEYADLHDRAGRMKAVGAVRESLHWSQSRKYFYWRLKRRLLESRWIKDLQVADSKLSDTAARRLLCSWMPADVGDVQAVDLLQKDTMHQHIQRVHAQAVRRKFCAAYDDLAAAGEVTGLRRSLLRCLLPRPSHGANSSEEMMPDVATTAVKDVQRAALPGLLGNQMQGKK